MKGSSSKMNANMLKKLMLLGQKQGSIRLSDLALEMGIGEEETLVFLREVFPAGTGAEIYHDKNECWIDINAEAIQYMLPLSPGEWMELYNVLKTAVPTNHVQSSLKKKVTENGPIKVVMELLNELDGWEKEVDEELKDIIALLDQAVVEKSQVQLTTKEDRSYLAFPCKVVHLEGELSIIAEDSQDHCLMVVSLKDLNAVQPVPTSRVPRVSSFEIEEFIGAIRTMNEKETRLILKIHDPLSVNLFPNYHFLGKPCMITNSNGDLIWAAYVEPCEPLFDWLNSLGTKVEIMDPVKFKQEYLTYCEEKVRKIA